MAAWVCARPGERWRCVGLGMGLLSGAARALVRGADRMSKWTSKRGPRTFCKGRGAKGTGFHGRDGKFVQIKEMIPELVVPELAGFKLKPYVNYRAPEGTDTPLTAKQLFLETAAPAIEKDFKAGTFDPEHLEKYIPLCSSSLGSPWLCQVTIRFPVFPGVPHSRLMWHQPDVLDNEWI